ncbi:uncharacterized protein NPIL_675801 [Nephila pilipes]|uniref:Peptidase A2 domain-containing protein n=1 Tax=Nephila pilipes TaxID=299642 RepID=A0A8X6M6C9_NEPPI|nr:uncharacterized protein NPIL_675801 [Nephila pilipes]
MSEEVRSYRQHCTCLHKSTAFLESESGDLVQTNGEPVSVKPYAALRTRLCSQYAESEEQRLRGLISRIQLGDRKSSRLLLEMRSKVDRRISEELPKSLFIQRLPTHVLQILAISNDQLDKLTEMAHGIMAIADPTSSIHGIDAENQDLKTMLMEISSHLSRLETRERSTSRGPEGRFRRRSSSRESGAHKHCWYHRYFKERATSAENHVPSRRKTRAAVDTLSDGAMVTNRLYLSDRTSRLKYLIDTGTDVSIIPPTTV